MPVKPVRMLMAHNATPETEINAMPHTGAKQIEATQEKPANLLINAKGTIIATSNINANTKVDHILFNPPTFNTGLSFNLFKPSIQTVAWQHHETRYARR